MSLTDLILKLVDAKCPKCKYAINSQDLQKAQTQLQAGILVCPKCQYLIRAGYGNGGFSTGDQVDKANLKPIEQIQFTHLHNGSLEFIIP